MKQGSQADDPFADVDDGQDEASEAESSEQSNAQASTTSLTDESELTDDDSSASGKTLKEERTQVPMMLTDEEKQQVEALWKKIDAEATAEGLELQKHRDFWTAVVPVLTANEDEIREELGL